MGKLTIKELEALRSDDDGKVIREDDGLIGSVRARAGGISVKFDWRYRLAGKVRETTLGSWPKTSMPEIRRERKRLADMVRDGRDPAEEKRADRLRAKADQAEAIALQSSRLLEIEAVAARMTVNALFLQWEKIDLKSRKDKGAEVRRAFEKDILPTMGNVAAEDVKRSMVAACLDNVVERGSPIVARNLLGDLRQMFGFAIKREYVEHDPTSHLKRDDFGKKVERDRVLDEAEVRLLHKMLPAAEMQAASAATIWIMLSTCCRVGEISQAQWSDVDLNEGRWRIPPDNSKNGKEHKVYMSDFARHHFQVLRKISGPSLWVLPASHRKGHVCLKSLAKQIGDRQRGEAAPMANRTKLTQALELPRGKWTPHDLRRTGATMMGRLGVRPDVIEKCLNHVEQNRLVRIYQRQTLEAEQAAAWNLLGERLGLLVRDDVDNVVTFNQGAA